jgi:hypothetical protein
LHRPPNDREATMIDVLGSGAPTRDQVLGVLVFILDLAVILSAVAVLAVRTAPAGPALGQLADGAEAPAPLSPNQAAAARQAAGCEVLVDGEPLEDRRHIQPGEMTPDDLYPDHRPAHSGRHYGTLVAVPTDAAEQPIDERAVTHNLEHGSVVVWFDLDAVDDEVVQQIAGWRNSRGNRLGFASESNGAVFASPATVIDSGKPVAFRAWGVAMDCDEFDPVVADAFLIDHWGSHGSSPEAHLSPYPEDSLRFAQDA